MPVVKLTPTEQFAQNLRAARTSKGLSQEGLGHASGIHRTEVSLLERAQREPRLGTIVRLARALDIPVAKLLDGIRSCSPGATWPLVGLAVLQRDGSGARSPRLHGAVPAPFGRSSVAAYEIASSRISTNVAVSAK